MSSSLRHIVSKVKVTCFTLDFDEGIFVDFLMLPRPALLEKTLGNLQIFMLQDAISMAIKKKKNTCEQSRKNDTQLQKQIEIKGGRMFVSGNIKIKNICIGIHGKCGYITGIQ